MVDTKFLHVGITCKDQKRFEEYYTKYFQMKRARTIDLGDGKELVFLKDNNGFYFEIFPMDEERPIPFEDKDGPHYPGYRHLAFNVENVDAKLKEMGKDAVITQGPMDFDDVIKGWRTVWVKDPEGNIVEITQGYRDE